MDLTVSRVLWLCHSNQIQFEYYPHVVFPETTKVSRLLSIHSK